jgi:hypothetical protein
MTIRRICSTVCFLHKNGNNRGVQIEQEFGSVEDAKFAALPQGCAFAYIPVDDGYVYSPRWGWETCMGQAVL